MLSTGELSGVARLMDMKFGISIDISPANLRQSSMLSLRHQKHAPSGPAMRTVGNDCVCRAVLLFLLPITGGMISNVTPGGMERGALPIFEFEAGDAEKFLDWNWEALRSRGAISEICE